MIRRALRLTKSLIAAALATAALPPSDTKAAARERFEKRAKEAGPGPGFVASHRRPRPEVARPPVSWWLAASEKEKADMRVALRLALGRHGAPSRRHANARIADHRRRLHVLEKKRDQHVIELPTAAEPADAARLRIARLDFEILRQQCILRDMRNLERRRMQRIAARKQAAQVAASAGKAIVDTLDGHILGAW